jgi:hypothetical protein
VERLAAAPALLSGGGRELDDELGWNPAAVSYLDALAFGPAPVLGGIQAAGAGLACARGRAAGARLAAGGSDVPGQGTAQCPGMLRAQVNLVLGAVQAKPDRALSRTSTRPAPG